MVGVLVVGESGCCDCDRSMARDRMGISGSSVAAGIVWEEEEVNSGTISALISLYI